jgi:hypothetical protein
VVAGEGDEVILIEGLVALQSARHRASFVSANQPGWPFIALFCQVSTHALHIVSGHPLHLRGRYGFRDPAFDHGRTLDHEIDLSDQGGAVEDQQALFHLLDAHAFALEGLSHLPALAADINLPWQSTFNVQRPSG